MEDHDAFDHLISVLRQAAEAGNQTLAIKVVGEIEARVRRRLSDLPPPIPDEMTKNAHALAGQPTPKPEWDFTKVDYPYGVGHLLTVLKPDFDAVRSGRDYSRKNRPVLRWYPAAQVLRCCLAVSEYGASATMVGWLSDALRDLPAHEQAIGTKLRTTGRSPGSKPDTKKLLLAVAKRLKKEGTSVREAAFHVYIHDKLGTSPEANRRAWIRHLKKLER